MKIGIDDGCANGGMMDSLDITPMEDDSEEYFFKTEVTDEEWEQWQAFLVEHDKWESFWDKKIHDYEESEGSDS